MTLIVNDDGTFEWGSPDACDVCLFCRDACDVPLEDLAQMSGVDLSHLTLSPPAQAVAFKTLGVDPVSVPWHLALGREEFSRRMRDISQTVQGVSRDHQLMKYVQTYRQCRKFLRGLSRHPVDPGTVRQLIADCESGLSVIKTLKSFMPEEDGLAPRVVYSQTSTATGRLIVERGPSILTLPKDHKRLISPRPGSIICEVDYVSLEPRLVLLLGGREAPDDIYEHMGRTLFGGEITRKSAKLATLSALYGSSEGLVASFTGSATSARTAVKRVADYFGVEDLSRKLRYEISQGPLRNFYGRPLLEVTGSDRDAKLINHYIQSSAVDTALLGFAQLSGRVKDLGASPIYVIHDSVIFDVPTSRSEDFLRECDRGVGLDVGRFNLKASVLS